MFFRRFLSNPTIVGSITPSSKSLSMQIASQAISLSSAYTLIELGPGSGAITKFLPKDTVSVEVDADFVAVLQNKFPERNIINTDAADYLRNLKSPVTIISSIPLIGNPNSENIKNSIKLAYRTGVIKSLITYSYGRKSPYSDCNFISEQRTKCVFLNIPPANIWVYS